MELRHLAAFAAVAEKDSFTAARDVVVRGRCRTHLHPIEPHDDQEATARARGVAV
jgi:hypothetical protein